MRRFVPLLLLRVGRIGDSAAVPALIETLKEKDWHVYHSAAEALKQIGTPEAMKAVEGKKNR